jgi:GGDEF domain-containing protein
MTAARRLGSVKIGMAATNTHEPFRRRSSRGPLAAEELLVRLREEVSRASRHRTALSCLLVSLEDSEELARAHGEQLPRQALAFLGAALRPELRNFDRVGHAAEGELLVLLPGADDRRGEIVARRALGRLHAVKIEVGGERRPLRISVGLACWREGLSGEQLLSQTRLAARRDPGLSAGHVADYGGPERAVG